ncbi:MAG: hypothetical protein KatS3mg109_2266 [Pirellulaceae bacterium]|nr:MAG: hypothetical protein KatS3mg109_2266 [Pirellulaceae bacterium]
MAGCPQRGCCELAMPNQYVPPTRVADDKARAEAVVKKIFEKFFGGSLVSEVLRRLLAQPPGDFRYEPRSRSCYTGVNQHLG